MGAKKTLPAYHAISAGAMATTATVASSAIDISNIDNIGIEIAWTGTAVGSLSVQCSVSGTTYNALTFNPALTQPAGTAGGYVINLNQVPFKFLKISYTNASGSGVLNAWVFGKDVN